MTVDLYSRLLHHHIEFDEDYSLVIEPRHPRPRPIRRPTHAAGCVLWGRSLGSPITAMRLEHAD
jgi:hypothetical protein